MFVIPGGLAEPESPVLPGAESLDVEREFADVVLLVCWAGGVEPCVGCDGKPGGVVWFGSVVVAAVGPGWKALATWLGAGVRVLDGSSVGR